MTNDNYDPLDSEKTIEQPASEHGSYLLSTGQSLGQYKIIRPLGRGGMGEVYEVENAVNRKRVALKVLPRSATGGSFVDRFRIESRVMSDLRHEHIVLVHHTGEENGLYYLTMDLVTGPEGEPQSLEDLLKDEGGKLKAEAVRDCALQILDALEYAHARDVVHRDLKPANILVSEDGTLKVTDFGLAKVVGGEYLKSVIDRSISLSMAGEVSIGEEETVVEGKRKRPSSSARALLGTYDYMAPEQKSGGEITVRTDIYAFGVMLYRMLTGEKPEGAYEKPSSFGVSKAWDAIVQRCLKRNPADRYASASELRREIERVSGRGRMWKPLAVTGVALGIAVLGLNWFSQSGRTEAEQAPSLPVSPPVVPQAPAIAPVAAVAEAEAVEVRFSVKPAGARVSVFSDRGLVAQQQTDAQGDFTVQLTPGSYEFEAQLDGYQLYAQRLQVDEAMSREIELVPLRGALTVLTTPGAEVTAKGGAGTLRLGKADAKGELRYERLVEGDYELTMTHKDYQPATARVTIASGRPQQVRQILKGKPGSIYISASPQAGVWVDGERKGSTGEQIDGLEPGERQVEVRLSGFRTERFTLEVPPNAQAPRKVLGNLVRESGRIQVEAQVPDYAREFFAGAGKRVQIGDGAWKSVTTLPYIEEGAACEEHEVRLEVAGFRVEPEVVRSRVEDEKTATARFILTPEPARLTVESNASGAEVFDSRGNRLGMAGTAFDVPSLQPVSLVVRASGFSAKTIKLGSMSVGSEHTRTVELVKDGLVDGEGHLLQLGGGERMQFQWIPPGSFMMGSTKAERDWAADPNGGKGEARWFTGETDPKRVAMAKGFWLGQTTVTVGQWKRFVSETGYRSDAEKRGEAWCFSREENKWTWMKGKSWRDPNWLGVSLRDDHPVACISWNDAKAFCEWLNRTHGDKLPDGYEFRLPGEAEWEYAARGGREGTKFWWGDRLEDGRGRFNGSGDDDIGLGTSRWTGNYNWSDGYGWASPVDAFGARGRNGFGLADMLGNVWEWCEDWYDEKGPHATINRTAASFKVRRGGSFPSLPGALRCAYRAGLTPSLPCAYYGFRVCVGVSL